MSAKNRDNKNRWRNITVGFRVSPEENELINKAVALSGLPKQEYCYRRCLNQDVVVQGNPRGSVQARGSFRILSRMHRIPDRRMRISSRARQALSREPFRRSPRVQEDKIQCGIPWDRSRLRCL